MTAHRNPPRQIALASIPPGGTERTFSAGEAERAALAEAYGLLAVKALSAALVLTPEPKGVVAVTGRVRAEIVQACVVTLDPVEQAIDEPVAARFTAARDVPSRGKPQAEVVVDPAEAEPPEILADGVLDLGAVVLEHFVLAIDPYPRAQGAALPTELASPAAEGDSPFAGLAGLREKIEKGG